VQKLWSVLFGGVILGELALCFASPALGWWLPKNVCTYGPEVDKLFYIILWVTAFFFVLTEAILVYNLFRASANPGGKSTYTHGNHQLEFIWTLIPALILLFIAYTQISAWERIKYVSRMPRPDQVMEVNARQFEWRVRYPSVERLEEMEKNAKSMEEFGSSPHADDVHVVNEIHIWKGQKASMAEYLDYHKKRGSDIAASDSGKDYFVGGEVKVFLKTRDVIHSFFLPHMRVKQDALPGKTIPVWFQSMESNGRTNDKGEWEETEVWELACAELCGWGHYKMQGKLFVHPDKADFLKWLKKAQAEGRRSSSE
jgi:cytochrome c oxidase subunit 2